MSALVLRSARRHLHNFVDEAEIVSQQPQAMDGADCEAYLQLGIDAFHWLVRADETIRRSIFEGRAAHDPQSDEAIAGLFRAWLAPCQLANAWIGERTKTGDVPTNAEEFRECQRQVEAIVRALDADEMTDAMRQARDAAVTEHLHGETAEFV